MKRETIITMSAISLVTLAAIGGLAFRSFAAGPAAYGYDKTTGPGGTFLGRRWGNKPLTPEQQAQIDARQADAQAKFDAIQKAFKDNNYDAWVAAVKAINPNAPILGKINSGNFGKLAEANADLENARTILKDLGIDGPGFGLGMGPGYGRGMMSGYGRGMMGRWSR